MQTIENGKASTRFSFKNILFYLAGLFCLTPWSSPPIALALGLLLAITIEEAVPINKKLTSILLQASVVGLGFGIHIEKALQAGKTGVLFTIVTIAFTLLLGYLVGKWLKIEKKVAYLISCGTAICGGSAIAAIAPIIQAEKNQFSVAIGTVFILNSVALFVFPWIGHHLDMTSDQFGLWSAIAIHDTSSVVGAASKFGEAALQSATTIKLARALWIIPVSLVTSSLYKNTEAKIKIPYFIGFFIIAMIIASYVPGIEGFSAIMVLISRKGLTLTLFLIGTGLSRSTLREVGIKPFILGLILWICISLISLTVILKG